MTPPGEDTDYHASQHRHAHFFPQCSTLSLMPAASAVTPDQGVPKHDNRNQDKVPRTLLLFSLSQTSNWKSTCLSIWHLLQLTIRSILVRRTTMSRTWSAMAMFSRQRYEILVPRRVGVLTGHDSATSLLLPWLRHAST